MKRRYEIGGMSRCKRIKTGLVVFAVLICAALAGRMYAGAQVILISPNPMAQEEIVILYENDVHCAAEGYVKLAAMKEELSQTVGHVGVVSVGDYIQGGSLGAVSQGEYIVELMNLVGYDAVALGNHEFDYKLPRLMELVEMMDTKPVCCNFMEITESGKETVFEPYVMVSYGETDIAYIGVTTPSTLTSAAPSQFFDEDGTERYTFEGDFLFKAVQESIDAARAAGAEYVIALSHLGTESVPEEWCAQDIVRSTAGLDAVLDGHSHSEVESLIVTDEGDNDVVISSTGTKFANIGKLTITDGKITTELIPMESYEGADPEVSARLEAINQEYQKLGERKIGETQVKLTTVDENGVRLIRNTETNLGDFCADAFREVTGADIGFVNGGGIRADIAIGEVTFNDILNVFPWNNRVCVAEVTGQQIVDMLELGVMNYPAEDGSFQHVAGITFEVNRELESSVKLDENMMFAGVEGEYRVSNVMVENRKTGEYEPIDPNKIYTLASHNHLLLDLGGGASMFRDAKIIEDNGMLDVELLEIYITEHLDGVIGEQYADAQERIRISAAEDRESDGKEEEAVDQITYTIVWGDTLWSLSKKHGCTVADIVSLNSEKIQDPDWIIAGWKIRIPAAAK